MIFLSVAYGTSQKTDRLHRGEFRITKSEHTAAYESAGLTQICNDCRPWGPQPREFSFAEYLHISRLNYRIERSLRACSRSKNRYRPSTFSRAQGVLRRNFKLDFTLGSCEKQRIGILWASSSHP